MILKNKTTLDFNYLNYIQSYTKAPEIFMGKGQVQYSNKVDVWSLGIIFYQMLFDLTYPYDGKDE
jgi:serine/threonine protein kinase